jgi:dipeptidyl aminopeptidase/acylaminoacyl peptidase
MKAWEAAGRSKSVRAQAAPLALRAETGAVGELATRWIRHVDLPMKSILTLLALPLVLHAARPMTFDDLMALRRLSDPQVSPDGRWVAFVQGQTDLSENRINTDIWVVPMAGGSARQLTTSLRHDRHPRWSPDGRWLVFESNRDGHFQLWVLPVEGGEARRLTSISTDATGPIWSPDGRHVAFLSAVFPEFSDKPFSESDRLNREKIDQQEKPKSSGRIFDQLPVRRWDSWFDGRRQHLFVLPVTNGAAAGEPRDITPGPQDATPWSTTFAAGDEFDWSPDGREIAFTAPPLPQREEAWRTDHNLWAVTIEGGRRRPLTTNPAADGCPRFSPDGRWLAYRAQARPGFEADRWQLFVLDRTTGAARSLTAAFDSSVESLAWAADSGTVVFEAEDKGTKRLWTVPTSGGEPRPITTGGVAGEPSVGRQGDVIFTLSRTIHPAQVQRVPLAGGATTRLDSANADSLGELAMTEPESVTVRGAGGAPVQMWVIKPPGFDPAKKHPLVFWVHGGPQGVYADGWSWRWNPQLWAAQGYVIATPNPRGSTGFGQRFTDEISRDWGGRVYEDLLAALAWLEEQPWIDTGRMAAAGGSFGGYMMNWFQGHTAKFRTLVTHCGVYENASMYGTTDELWFDEWEHGIPWETDAFAKDSPDQFAARFRTPNLVIHNELDYRVPIGQGLSLFTALQRQGVPSRLLYFPDEGHWVLKPQNSRLWHSTIFGWLAEYLKAPPR